MQVQPITNNNVSSMGRYHDLSKTILNSERKDLIKIAELFHKSPENELKEITRSDEKAYKMLKEAIDGVITRKKCYLADGSSFCAQRAKELDALTSQRRIYLMG